MPGSLEGVKKCGGGKAQEITHANGVVKQENLASKEQHKKHGDDVGQNEDDDNENEHPAAHQPSHRLLAYQPPAVKARRITTTFLSHRVLGCQVCWRSGCGLLAAMRLTFWTTSSR